MTSDPLVDMLLHIRRQEKAVLARRLSGAWAGDAYCLFLEERLRAIDTALGTWAGDSDEKRVYILNAIGAL